MVDREKLQPWCTCGVGRRRTGSGLYPCIQRRRIDAVYKRKAGAGDFAGNARACDTEHIEKAFDFGGMPARNGVTAASMAAHGFTGVDDVFSGERNFFVAYDESARTGEAPEPERLISGLGSAYEILETTIKRWTVGSPVQAPLDALAELMRTHRIKADDVERVTVRIPSFCFNTVNNNDNMPNVCMQYLCAVMLLDSVVTFEASHSRQRMNNKRVQEIRGRIELIADDELMRIYSEQASYQGIVEIRLKNGRKLNHHTKAFRGTPKNPMTRPDVDDKAFYLLAPTLGRKRARGLCDAVWSLEKTSNVRRLRPLLRA